MAPSGKMGSGSVGSPPAATVRQVRKVALNRPRFTGEQQGIAHDKAEIAPGCPAELCECGVWLPQETRRTSSSAALRRRYGPQTIWPAAPARKRHGRARAARPFRWLTAEVPIMPSRPAQHRRFAGRGGVGPPDRQPGQQVRSGRPA